MQKTLKNRRWLEFTEYALLAGSGAGAVAAVVSKQVIYASAPISLLILLHLVNRRRFEKLTEENITATVSRLERQLAKHLNVLSQQVNSLPTVEMVGRLRHSILVKNQEALAILSKEIAEVQQEMEQRLVNFEGSGLSQVRQDICQLQDQYVQVCESLGNVTTQLHRLSPATRVENVEEAIAQLRTETMQLRVNLGNLTNEAKPNIAPLQDQINHLNRQFQRLPAPVDSNSLKEEVGELIKAVSELVPKRDLIPLTSEVHELHQQQKLLQQAIAHLKGSPVSPKQFNEPLPQPDSHSATLVLTPEATLDQLDLPQVAELSRTLTSLSQEFTDLESRFNQLAKASTLADLYKEELRTEIQSEIQEVTTAYVSNLQWQLATVQQFTQTLEHQQKQLRDQINQLPQTLDAVALQHEVQSLANRVTEVEGDVMNAQGKVGAAVQGRLDEINQRLQAMQTDASYELVFDLKSSPTGQGREIARLSGSRAVLEEALKQTQERLIVICPWSNQCDFDDDLLQRFKVLLERKGHIDIGWCHLGDRNEERFLSNINQRWYQNPLGRGDLYQILNRLLRLKKLYPGQFGFKVLGTNENFLVSDRAFAVLGLNNVATTSPVFPELELKLRTADTEVIQGLINRFDAPILNPKDAAAYFNRGMTRHDLGDKRGAIEDFTQVLVIESDDANAYNNRGLARYDLGDKRGAIADFSQTLSIDLNHFAAYCNRGFTRSELGDQDGAITDYSIAIRVAPDSAIAHFYRGVAFQKLGDHRGAIDDYSVAIRLNSQSAATYCYRGAIRQKLGDEQGAIADLEQAARLFAEQGEQANYLKVMETLNKLQKTVMTVGSHSLVG